MKKCGKCKNEKDLSEFGFDKQRKDGLNFYCKLCIRKRSSNQRKRNPEHTKRYAQEYREKNRKIIRKKAWLTYYIDWDKRRQQSKKSYEKHKEKIAKKRADRSRLQEIREFNRIRQAEWRKKNKSKVGEIVSKWKKRNPQKAAAHTLVLWAIRTGVLVRSNKCEECGISGKMEGHHEDYMKPLEVKWLCKECHGKKHQLYR